MPNGPIRSRRRGGLGKLDAGVNVAMTAELRARLDATAERYDVAVGLVARLAIDQGLRGVQDLLRREARRERAAAGDGAPPGAVESTRRL